MFLVSIDGSIGIKIGPIRIIIIITMIIKWQLILSLRDRWLARRVNQDYADKGSVAHRVRMIAMMMVMITKRMIMVINGLG